MKFGDMEEKILAALEGGLPYLKTVGTYAGQFEADVKTMPAPFPAAYVVYRGSSFEPVDSANHMETADFTVLAAARGFSGGEDLRKSGYGIYRMTDDIILTLTNQRFGLDIAPVRPLRLSLVFASKTVAVYAVDFRTSFDRTF
ncbi:MAG: DUF1834 family protein [Nitrospiraceae bacterium]|nr:DUF1834 family protein [Nitrospiraceae bacterium]